MWIARGTLPLALFGAERYATLIGRLAFPALITQALAPSAVALLIEGQGAGDDDGRAYRVGGAQRRSDRRAVAGVSAGLRLFRS